MKADGMWAQKPKGLDFDRPLLFLIAIGALRYIPKNFPFEQTYKIQLKLRKSEQI